MLEEISHLFDQHGVIGVNLVPNVFLSLDDHPAVLERIQLHFLAGGVVPLEGSRTFHQWHVQKYDQVENILSTMLPYLRRQERQAQYALELTRCIRRLFNRPKTDHELLYLRLLSGSILLANEEMNDAQA